MVSRARVLTLFLALGLALVWFSALSAQDGHAPKKPTGPSFADATKGMKKLPGFFDLYVGKDKVYAAVKSLDQPFLYMASVSRGTGTGMLPSGTTLSTRVLAFTKGGEKKLFLLQKSIRFKAKPGSPLSRSVSQAFSDSVLLAIPIIATGAGTLIDLKTLFGGDFEGLGRALGGVDGSRSRWGTVKSFPKNTEIRRKLVFRSSRRSVTVPDSRGMQITMHYSLAKMPAGGYTPRLADDRIGYFLTVKEDFSKPGTDGYVRYINRWRLQKADPSKAKSPAKTPIIFWIENTVPFALRPYIRDALLQWNKAFEQAGIIDAIEVRQMPDDAEWDPEDARYNTIRWTAGHPMGYAIGPSRVNPLTGEILDADILVDANFVRYWRDDYTNLLETALADDGRDSDGAPFEFAPATWLADPAERDALDDILGCDRQRCAYGAQKSLEMGFAWTAFRLQGKSDASGEPPIDFMGQNLRDLVMHEVGHTLGLRHNFKASTMLTLDEMGDLAKTKETGLWNSVMEYAPVRIAGDPKKQGYYATPTVGPYDRWAIEYGYCTGDKKKLAEIASRSGDPKLAYGTDEDVGIDPYTARWDLGRDPIAYAQERITLVKRLLKRDWSKFTKPDEGYQPIRSAFGTLVGQHRTATGLATRFIGGVEFNRHHPGDKNGKLPITPVSREVSLKALKFLDDTVFAPGAISYPKDILRQMAPRRWSTWGENPRTPDGYPIERLVLSEQLGALYRLYSSSVLERLQEAAAIIDQPLTLNDVFSATTGPIWRDATGAKPIPGLRRALQAEHLGILASIWTSPGGMPTEARALARQTIIGIRDRCLNAAAQAKDATSRVHFEAMAALAKAALEARMGADVS